MLHLPLYVRACTRAYWCEYVRVYVRVVRAFGRVTVFVERGRQKMDRG